MRRRAALALGAVLLLVGCSAAGAAAEHVVTYEPSGEGGDGALLTGVVEVRAGCLLVRSEGGALHLPAFPDDEVGWDDARLVYAGRTYADGDPIELGGGVTGPVGTVPEACRPLAATTSFTVAAR